MDGIARAAASGLKVGVITAVNALNMKQLPLLLDFLPSVGVSHWQIQPNLPQGRSADDLELHLSPTQYVELGEFFHREHTRKEIHGLTIVPADSLGYFTGLDIEDPPWRGCPAGQYAVGITSDGRVKGCLTLPDHISEGDLHEADLWEIWFREDAFPYTRQFTIADLGPECRHCDKAEQCQGGCSSMSIVCSGSFHNDPYCFHGIQHRPFQPHLGRRLAS